MLTFKQFLLEMPILLQTRFRQPTFLTDVDSGFKKKGEIKGTKEKYDLYHKIHEPDTNYGKYYAVHRKSKEVHMEVSGEILHRGKLFQVGNLRATQNREKGMAKHFYNAILDRHDILSDNTHTPDSLHLYRDTLPSIKGVTIHKPTIKRTATGGRITAGEQLDPRDLNNYYGEKNTGHDTHFYVKKVRKKK